MTALSDIDKQIAELEAKKKALIKKEKDDAMDKVKTALAELNALGFNYSLSDGTTTTRTTRTRRSGVRNDVLALIKKSPSGLTRADVLAAYENPPHDWGDKSAWRLFNAVTYALEGRVAENPNATRELHQTLDLIAA